MSEKNEIIRECYAVIGTAIADGKTKKEVYTAIADFAKEHELTVEQLTKYVNNFYYKRASIKKLPDMLEEVHDAFFCLKKDKAKKKMLELKKHELSKEEQAAIIRNNELKTLYSNYFNALINAYNRLLPIDIALEEVEEETGLAANDIKRYAEIYLINYASNFEKSFYRQKLEKYKKVLANPTVNFLARVNVLEINKIINNDLENQDSKIRSILINQDLKTLKCTRNAVIKYFTKYFDTITDKNARNVLFNREQMILNIIDDCLKKLDIKKEEEIKNTPAQKRRNEIFQEFMQHYMTIEDLMESRLTKYNEKISHKAMKEMLYQASKENNLEEEFIIHLNKVEEYEREYIESILDIMCYYLQNGIPVSDSENKRTFTIIDYYNLTSYPLEKLKLRAVSLNLLDNIVERKLFMTFATQNIQKGSYALNITLQGILNDLEITKQFGSSYRKLTSDEKIAIYYLMKERKVPMTFTNFGIAVSEYAHNRLFLARR